MFQALKTNFSPIQIFKISYIWNRKLNIYKILEYIIKSNSNNYKRRKNMFWKETLKIYKYLL